MKSLSSARITQNLLPDGRLEFRMEHDVLRGVTPRMLVWWLANIEGEMELGGKTYPRYLIFHPIDHIHYAVLQRVADGRVAVGAKLHVVEALGADMRNLVDVVLRLAQLDEAGARLELHVLGRVVLQIEGEFLPQPEGTKLISTMIVGSDGPLGARLGLNRLLIGWFFPVERQKAWLKHNVEEFGNLEFFLPALYERHAGAAEEAARAS